MSGGVDSSVVAALLLEKGHEVIGVHMKLHDVEEGEAGHCCGLDDAMDARMVADTLGIPFYVMDLREAFKKAVMADFAESYRSGRTPNPCIRCNGVLKFRVLLQRAKALGASHLATGHYAKVTPEGRLFRAVGAASDGGAEGAGGCEKAQVWLWDACAAGPGWGRRELDREVHARRLRRRARRLGAVCDGAPRPRPEGPDQQRGRDTLQQRVRRRTCRFACTRR